MTKSKDLASLQATVHGYVQGVFFRAFVSHWAEELGLSGYVRNLPSGAVEVVAEGEKKQLEKLIGYLKVGPPSARVERVVTNWSGYSGKYSGFSVRY
jgi:acylphosphatase